MALSLDEESLGPKSCLRLPVSPARGSRAVLAHIRYGVAWCVAGIRCRSVDLLGKKALQAALRPPRPQSGLERVGRHPLA